MALFVIVFSLNMFDKMIETINNVKPIKKNILFHYFYYLLFSIAKVQSFKNVKC